MYEKFAPDYDRFVNWQARLSFEMPFLDAQLNTLKVTRDQSLIILDAACGTGMHAIELAKKGYHVKGADKFEEIVSKAIRNTEVAGVDIPFHTVGFGTLEQSFSSESFNALLCLGNSLPHVLSMTELQATLTDFYKVLTPDGLVIIQNRNFDKIVKFKNRWMEPQAFVEEASEWVFQRFYDFEANGLIRFNIVMLKRTNGEQWQMDMVSTLLMPLMADELITELQVCGFNTISTYGSLNGEAFDLQDSENLVITAHKKS